MYLQSISSNSFGAKNTYLAQAKKAINSGDKQEFLSYHYEAKARNHDLRYLKTKRSLEEVRDLKFPKNFFKLTKIYLKMAYERLASINNMIDAYKADPFRF